MNRNRKWRCNIMTGNVIIMLINCMQQYIDHVSFLCFMLSLLCMHARQRRHDQNTGWYWASLNLKYTERGFNTLFILIVREYFWLSITFLQKNLLILFKFSEICRIFCNSGFPISPFYHVWERIWNQSHISFA